MRKGPRPRWRALYLVPVFAVVALLAWALASPVGASPDDDYHLTSIWCANPLQAAQCGGEPGALERSVPATMADNACYATIPTESAACQDALLEQVPEPKKLTDRGNFAATYPPVYYATMSLFVGPDVAASAFAMRLVNILLFVGLTTAIYALLPRDRRPALAWSWIVTTVPLGLFLVASNNPSAWAIMGVGSLWAALLGYFETTGRRKIALGALAVLSTLIAAGSRSDSASYAVFAIVLVTALVAHRSRRFLIDAILPAVLVIVAFAFFLTSRQTLMGVQGFGPAPGRAAPALEPAALMISNLKSLPDLWAGVFGTWSLGWFDTTMPIIVPFAGSVAFIAIVFSGLASMTPRKTAAVAAVAGVLVVLPLYVLFRGMQTVGQSLQPRYLLPLIVLLAGIALLTRHRKALRFTVTQLVLIVGALSVGQFVALHTNMRRYITGTDQGSPNLDKGIEWWWNIPFSPMFVLIIGSAAYTALLVIVARELWMNARVVDDRVPPVRSRLLAR